MKKSSRFLSRDLKKAKKEEKFVCLLCHSNNYEILWKRKLINIPLNLSICKDCGFVYLNPRWTNESYNKFYQKVYSNYSKRSIETSIETYSIIINRIDKIISFDENKSINILDVGSSMGDGLRTFKMRYKNSNLFAIESSKECLNNLKKHGIKRISNDVNSDWEKTKNKFDIVIMRHVLEHLSYPEKALSKIHKTLSNQGYLYIAVPNLDYADFPLTRTFFNELHISYFSKKNLKFFLEKNGFFVISINNKDSEVYAICKKNKIREKDLRRMNFNDYVSSKKKITSLLKREEKTSFIFYWKVRGFLVSLLKKLGIKSLVKDLVNNIC